MGVYSSILCSTGVILILCGKLFVLNILWEPFYMLKIMNRGWEEGSVDKVMGVQALGHDIRFSAPT